MRIFVANFDNETSEEDLQVLFSNYGTVREVKIWIDFETGESRDFGFVDMPDEDEAERAIYELDRRWWNGRRLKVNKARRQ